VAVPKKKTSKTRTKTRRAHISMKAKNLSLCSHCKTQILSHQACPKCGYYKGAEVMKIKTKIKRKNKHA